MSDQADPKVIDALKRIYHIERRSFVRYLIEEAKLKQLDESDEKAQARLDDAARDARGNAEKLSRLLASEDVRFGPGSWPLRFSTYHFLRSAYLLGPVKTALESESRDIESEVSAITNWPEAEAAVKELLARQRAQIEKIAELAAELPGPSAKDSAPQRRTSANWW